MYGFISWFYIWPIVQFSVLWFSMAQKNNERICVIANDCTRPRCWPLHWRKNYTHISAIPYTDIVSMNPPYLFAKTPCVFWILTKFVVQYVLDTYTTGLRYVKKSLEKVTLNQWRTVAFSLDKFRSASHRSNQCGIVGRKEYWSILVYHLVSNASSKYSTSSSDWVPLHMLIGRFSEV